MPLVSMTGFARADASEGGLDVQVEARCVNGRSSDIKLRLPSGLDHLDKAIRGLFQNVIRRGNANITISFQRESERAPQVNVENLKTLYQALSAVADDLGEKRPTLDQLVGSPGVVEMVDPTRVNSMSVDASNKAAQNTADDLILSCAASCAHRLATSRRTEGEALAVALTDLVDAMDKECQTLTSVANDQAHLFHARLKQQVDRLLKEDTSFSQERLHQEAALLATKADITEELTRLDAHIVALRGLMGEAEPVGRRLDFLTQECNREANTVCSKAASIEITQSGLALKALIDQIKEQVQNVE
ncbi:MAG: YicC/YloC family endoribonuclease [Pseudomonadota bacterium]